MSTEDTTQASEGVDTVNGVELRYAIFKALVGATEGASMISPVPGEPLRIGVLTKDPSGESRWFRISVEEMDGPEVPAAPQTPATAPEGFELPKAAARLIGTAKITGWESGHAWDVDTGGSPFVKVQVRDPETGETFSFTWHSRNTGTLRLFFSLHQKVAGYAWAKGPAVKAAIHRMNETHHART